ncbi:MAG: GNAT family N-acetyltransferase, partial [bacterium]|nr:GNAT family N-acetyltransferase [bacterium]
MIKLQSSRILLRRLEDSDLADFLEYRSRPEVAKYQYWKPFDEVRARQYISDNKNC